MDEGRRIMELWIAGSLVAIFAVIALGYLSLIKKEAHKPRAGWDPGFKFSGYYTFTGEPLAQWEAELLGLLGLSDPKKDEE
jgi:hypothetical protein